MGGAFSKNHHKNNEPKRYQEKKKKNSSIKVKRSNASSFNSRHERKKRYQKQVKRDQKSQRVSKEELYRLSFELSRTPWYLGRRLGLTEKEVRKVTFRLLSDQEIKFHILLTWRKRNGWKATIQNLVIHLELAGYDYEEYKIILGSEENRRGNIYDKPPDLNPPTTSNGYFRYDNYNAKTDDKGTKTYDQTSLLGDSTEEIISFARRSWKKPKKKEHEVLDMKLSLNKTDDSGIMTPELTVSPTASNMDEGSNTMQTNPSEREHHKDGSTLKLTRNNLRSDDETDSQWNKSETELSTISNKNPDDFLWKPQNMQLFIKPALANKSSRYAIIRHGRNDSTESQLESYREEIVRMSKKRYDVIKNEVVALENNKENGNCPSQYTFFKFGGKGKCSTPVRGDAPN